MIGTAAFRQARAQKGFGEGGKGVVNGSTQRWNLHGKGSCGR